MRSIIALLLFCHIYTFGQKVQNKHILEAEESVRNKSYVMAILQFEEILAKPKGLTPEDIQNIKLNLGELYFITKDYIGAEKNFSEVLYGAPNLKSDQIKAYQRFAQILSSLGNHGESAKMWQKFTDLQEHDKRGTEFVKLYKDLDPLTRNSNSYLIEYIGLNTASPDFSPAYYKNGLVFVSSREKNAVIKRLFGVESTSFLDLFYLEDLDVLNRTQQGGSLGSSSESVKKNTEKVGSNYYSPENSNDVSSSLGHSGSDYIKGTQNYEENPTIEVEKFSKKLNGKYHEGPCTFYKNGQKIIFTRSGYGEGLFGPKKGEILKLHLYSAEKTEKDWGNITKLPFNDDKYSCGHPTITNDGSLLFFVSDMPGGYGGTDIYYSIYDNGQWSTPQNAGGKINTLGNEMFPFVDENLILYFSSDGHPGIGDLDIFNVKIDFKTIKPTGQVRNLGAPLNSKNDDFGIITDSTRTMGYFSSNRKRGGVDDDIYKFTRVGSMYGCRDLVITIKDKFSKSPQERFIFNYYRNGDRSQKESAITTKEGTIKLCLPSDSQYEFVFDKKGYAGVTKSFSNLEVSDYEPSTMNIFLEPLDPEPIASTLTSPEKSEEVKKNRRLVQKNVGSDQLNEFRGTIIRGEDDEPESAVKVRFINKCTGEVQEMYTRSDGSYEFKRVLDCDYELTATKEGFIMFSEVIIKIMKKNFFGKKVLNKNAETSTNLFDRKIYKVGDVIKLENVYYKSDEYKIKDNSKSELDRVASSLKKYPNMILEISSHTDTRGNPSTNLILSQKRSEEILKYLTTQGIKKNRMKAIGKGETEPMNKCKRGVNCTEAEHQRNRRTEFKILRIENL
ncbi:MAG: OmpA family protein [Leadbetterella sp.]